ncbi:MULTISPECIES: hypothetical protein [Limnospira]|uniref:Uncharacterized protein n=1 Tax=Limnospira platensis NIES-46 TaxID=1236695 RepID=A0A5M3SZN0_LIMPL|nr:hypothetical protein [Arthrospira platensis]AMW30720.1 hypothetical protein AP285_25105 [Arthrospira platensis YZ]KDR55350.1 hypothetical protein APPUASWS_023640 [Arthrospira platensis str. Paraca]MDF2207272.1 hypothetical protein [Arthrospira platensis NCB002]MDT9185941.1 hypothetical protein [Limnospira sp. PMC 289.06]MDT9297691.1 hypothetical protein [Arthrospira platensis PCC 7345]MDT9313148.1 hypothetical protein [Limnospira sp. Paracas R14]BDT15731.1 hypothetical protein N39L_54540 
MGAWEDIKAVYHALYKYADDHGGYMVAETHKWWIQVSIAHLANYVELPIQPLSQSLSTVTTLGKSVIQTL